MNIEEMQFKKSEVLERLIVDWGDALCVSVKNAETVTELEAIRLLAIEFSTLTSTYSDSINGFNESLGISLIEAALFKIESIKTQEGSNEWRYYLSDDETALGELSNTLSQ